MRALINEIISNPVASLSVIGNLVIIESLLSVDNAAVLATMVMDLPKEQRPKALRYGIIGAYVFRGLALIFASVLIRFWYLKPIGGLYLLYLVYDWYKGKQEESESDALLSKKENWLYRLTVGWMGNFWATVALVELMDMAFSIDNVFAAVAFSDNIFLIWTGVFIGILAMRFVAQFFVRMMQRYWFLETAAFVVIAVLGIKLLLSLYEHFLPAADFSHFLGSTSADWIMSLITVSIFFVPLVTSILFDFPKKERQV